jgi:hypothetical protein
VSRRLLPRDAMARRLPLLALSLALLLAAFVLIGTGQAVVGFTLLVAAFLAVRLAKRS